MSITGRIKVDFMVFSEYDPKVLFIADNSQWLHIEEKPAIIEVTVPGSTKPLVFTYLKNGVNSFNSHNLKMTCFSGDCGEETYIDLPDGIYTITVKGSPDDFQKTKYHLKTDRLQIEVDKFLMDLGFRFNELYQEYYEDIVKVRVLLMMAEAFIRNSEVKESKRFYDLAKSEFDKIKECK